MTVRAKVDLSSAFAGLDKLAAAKYSLARSMAAAGGRLLRDEAKVRAPVGMDSENPGSLESAIYLAFRDGESTDTRVKYSVSWNASKAPHGHLLEFGYWQPFVVVLTPEGWRTLASGKGDKARGVRRADGPKWIPPHPFLRPAYEASLPRLKAVMVSRGAQRLPELLASSGGIK